MRTQWAEARARVGPADERQRPGAVLAVEGRRLVHVEAACSSPLLGCRGLRDGAHRGPRVRAVVIRRRYVRGGGPDAAATTRPGARASRHEVATGENDPPRAVPLDDRGASNDRIAR